jgi:transposase-like protein
MGDGSVHRSSAPLSGPIIPARDLARRALRAEYQGVECLLAECGLHLRCEAVRRWPQPSDGPPLKQMVVRIDGRRAYRWRGVGQENEILNCSFSVDNKHSALSLMCKLLEKTSVCTEITDANNLHSYG